MPDHQSLAIKFWGARGNIPPVTASGEFGNNTTAVEIIPSGAPSLFVDFGTGAMGAGRAALAAGVREFDTFLTHLHIDHLSGLFSFVPLYRRDCTIRVRAARSDCRQAFETLLEEPFHPVSFGKLAANLEFDTLPEAGQRLFPRQGLTVSWGPLHHPQQCTGFRFDDGRNAIVFATDVELGAPDSHAPLKHLLTHPYPAGLAVIDGFFTDAEVAQYAGWGHSSWGQAWALVAPLGVRHLLVTHHHPAKSDAELRALEAAARPVLWAREGQSYRVVQNTLAAL